MKSNVVNFSTLELTKTMNARLFVEEEIKKVINERDSLNKNKKIMEKFENYPQSKDGLYGDNYDCVTYTFMDPIKLIYKNGDIQGNIDVWGGDYISIIENKHFEINKRTINKNT